MPLLIQFSQLKSGAINLSYTNTMINVILVYLRMSPAILLLRNKHILPYVYHLYSGGYINFPKTENHYKILGSRVVRMKHYPH